MRVSVLEIEFLTVNNPLAYRWIDISLKFDGRILFSYRRVYLGIAWSMMRLPDNHDRSSRGIVLLQGALLTNDNENRGRYLFLVKSS